MAAHEPRSLPQAHTAADKITERLTVRVSEQRQPEPYYSSLGVTSEPLTLPSSLGASIAAIENLPANALLRFDRAVYWYYYARHLASARSVMAVCLGAAIEAMLEPDPDAPRCLTCQRELRGPTARFVDFMSSFLPSEDADAARRLFAELYGIRSRPAHGHVFETDFFPLASFTPTRLGEDDKVRSLFEYVRIALVNWLDAA